MAAKYLFAVLAISFLAGCGTPRLQQSLGTAESEVVRQDLKAEKPLVHWKLTQVTFDKARICLECGSNLGNYFEHYLNRRFNQEFPALLQKKLSESGIFDAGSGRSMSLVARLVKFDPGEGDRRIMTSRQLSVHYEFIDGNTVVGVRDITSVGKSNAFQGMERYPEAVDDAITRNIRLLVLSLIAGSNSAESGRARSEMAAIDAEARQDLRGSVGGIVLFGAIDSVKAVGSAVGGAVTFMGQNSGAISAGLNQTAAEMDRSNRSYNAAYAQALTASRPQPVSQSASSAPQSGNRPSNQQTAGNTTASGQRSASSPSTASAGRPSTQQTAGNTTSSGQRSASSPSSASAGEAATQRNEQARQQQLAQQMEERQQREAQERKEQERKEQERKRQQVEQKAAAERAKLAEAQAEKQARDGYLRNVAQGTRLAATKCPDGEGKYYATGSRPKIKPEVVACVDIQYRAYCPGGRQYSEGIAHNFIGMSGCFGDTYEINPKPACKVDEVRIEVVAAQSCR